MDVKEIHYSSEEWLAALDWVEVVDVDLGQSYEWDEFHAWYSPSKRVYFWASGSGCSCNYFGQDIRGVDDFENGRARSDVMAALNRYFDEQYLNHPQQRVEALTTVNAFSPRKLGQ